MKRRIERRPHRKSAGDGELALSEGVSPDEGQLMTDVPELVHPSNRPGRRRRWTIAAATGGLALVVGLVAACSSASGGTAVAGATGAW